MLLERVYSIRYHVWFICVCYPSLYVTTKRNFQGLLPRARLVNGREARTIETRNEVQDAELPAASMPIESGSRCWLPSHTDSGSATAGGALTTASLDPYN